MADNYSTTVHVVVYSTMMGDNYGCSMCSNHNVYDNAAVNLCNCLQCVTLMIRIRLFSFSVLTVYPVLCLLFLCCKTRWWWWWWWWRWWWWWFNICACTLYKQDCVSYNGTCTCVYSCFNMASMLLQKGINTIHHVEREYCCWPLIFETLYFQCFKCYDKDFTLLT